jgi:hypothetical protein
VRLAIMTGEKDSIFEADISRMNFQGLVLDGFRHVSYFEIPRGGHNHPDDTWFERGLDALDHPPDLRPPTTSPTREPHPGPGQIAQAARLLHTAQELLDGKNSKYMGWQAPGYLQRCWTIFRRRRPRRWRASCSTGRRRTRLPRRRGDQQRARRRGRAVSR